MGIVKAETGEIEIQLCRTLCRIGLIIPFVVLSYAADFFLNAALKQVLHKFCGLGLTAVLFQKSLLPFFLDEISLRRHPV